jgi:hypothetical protein
MGAASSVASAPADASDFTDVAAAKAEVVRLRKMIVDNMPTQLDQSNMVKANYRAGKAPLCATTLTPEMYNKFRCRHRIDKRYHGLRASHEQHPSRVMAIQGAKFVLAFCNCLASVASPGSWFKNEWRSRAA